MNNELSEILNEIFEDEIYDMCYEIPQGAISKKVSYAAEQFRRGARTVMFSISGYLFKIVNCENGFVSCSNPDETGVSTRSTSHSRMMEITTRKSAARI